MAEETKTFDIDSHIWDTETKTFNSDSHIWNTITKDFDLNANVWIDTSATFDSDSYIRGASTFLMSATTWQKEMVNFKIYATITEDYGDFTSTSNIIGAQTDGNFYSSTFIDGGTEYKDRFYTTAATASPAIISGSSESESLAKGVLLNDNLNTFWYDVSESSTKDITIDCKQTVNVDTFGMWIESYNNAYNADTITFYGSDDGVSWSGSYLTTINNNTGNGLYYVYTRQDYSYRYFKFSFNLSGSPLLRISRLFLMKRHTINREHDAQGSSIIPRWFNDRNELSGEHEQITMEHRNKVTDYKLAYDLTNTTMIDEVQSIFNESRGRLLCFVYQPDVAIDTAVLCKFNKDEPKWQPIHSSLWQATLEFTTVPYIISGEHT